MTTSRASRRRKRPKTPTAPKCPDCNGTGYKDGPTIDRVDVLGKTHRYISLVHCPKCTITGSAFITGLEQIVRDDPAKRAANDVD